MKDYVEDLAAEIGLEIDVLMRANDEERLSGVRSSAALIEKCASCIRQMAATETEIRDVRNERDGRF